MQLLKNKFLRLSIHKQIQIGVFTVSFCVFCIVFLLLAINIFILVNLTYTDITQIIEAKDTQQLEKIALMLELKNNIMTDEGKITIQWLRNFIEHNKRNEEFIKRLKYNPEDNFKYLIDIDQLYSENPIEYNHCLSSEMIISLKLNKCIFYKKLGIDISIYDTEGFKNYMKIVQTSIPLIQKSFKQRLQESQQSAIFNKVEIFSNTYKAMFMYFPKIDESENHIDKTINKSYSLMDFETYMTRVAYSSGIQYYRLSLTINKVDDPKDISNFRWNPVIQLVSPTETVLFPYLNQFLSNNRVSSIIASTSVIYRPDITAEQENLINKENIVDVVQGDWSGEAVDTISFNTVRKFKGVLFLMVDVDGYVLVTPSQCHYLLKFYEIQNDLSEYQKENFPFPITFWDCFIYNKEKIASYFNNTHYLTSFKRKARLNLFNDYYSRAESYDIKYKIFSNFSPDKFNIYILNSQFLINTSAFMFTFKNGAYLQSQVKNLKTTMTLKFASLLFFNLIILYLCLIVIVIIISNVTSKITRPINDLINQVENFGRGDVSSSPQERKVIFLEQKKALEKINYPDDNDIDEMFQICKSLLKGGFNEGNTVVNVKNKLRLQSLNSYNNISYIKTNNLIMYEDMNGGIMDNHPMFSWKFDPEGENIINTNTIGNDLTTEDYLKPEDLIIQTQGKTHKPLFLDLDEVRLTSFGNINTNTDPNNPTNNTKNLKTNPVSNLKSEVTISIFSLVASEEKRYHSTFTGAKDNSLLSQFMLHTNNGEDLRISYI